MAEVLVVAELVEGAVAKPTSELVTLARRVGDPVVVVLGEGAETVAAKVGEFGATRVLSVTDPALDDYLVAPKAEALAQIAEAVRPAAILLTSTGEGKEIAGRLAIKLGSGLITDATDVGADGVDLDARPGLYMNRRDGGVGFGIILDRFERDLRFQPVLLFIKGADAVEGLAHARCAHRLPRMDQPAPELGGRQNFRGVDLEVPR